MQGILVEDKAVEGGLSLQFRGVSLVNASHYDPLIHNQASKHASPITLTRAKGIDNGGGVRFEACSVTDDRNRSFFATGTSASHENRGGLTDVHGEFAVTNPFGCRVSLGPGAVDVSVVATSCKKQRGATLLWRDEGSTLPGAGLKADDEAASSRAGLGGTWEQRRALLRRYESAAAPPSANATPPVNFDYTGEGEISLPKEVVLRPRPGEYLPESALPQSWDWRSVVTAAGAPPTDFTTR